MQPKNKDKPIQILSNWLKIVTKLLNYIYQWAAQKATLI